MAVDVLTQESIRDYVTGQLGGSQVDIELLAEDIDRAGRQALRVYNHWCPRHTWVALPFTPATKRYELSHPGLVGVHDVMFLTQDDDATEFGDLFNPLYGNTTSVATLGGGSMYSDYAMILQYREMARQIASTEAEWRGDWEAKQVGDAIKRVYALYVSATSAVQRVAYEYVWHVAYEDGENGGLAWLPAPDHDWFLRYVLNESLPPLIRALNKFGGVMTPEGGQDPTDANDLQARHDAEKEKLHEEIKARTPPVLPSLG